jgi:hypothetical protein
MGSVTVAPTVIVQLWASVTVTIYVPAVRPVAVAVVCTGVVLQLYVYGVVPPDAATVTEPLLPPLHDTLVNVDAVASSVDG